MPDIPDENYPVIKLFECVFGRDVTWTERRNPRTAIGTWRKQMNI